MYVYAFVLSRVWLYDPMDYSPSGSPIHWIFHSRIVEWVAISFSRESSWPRDRTCILCVSCIGRLTLYCHAKMLCWVNKTHTHTHKEYIQYEFLSTNSTNFSMKKSAQWLPLGRWKQRLNWKECEKCLGCLLSHHKWQLCPLAILLKFVDKTVLSSLPRCSTSSKNPSYCIGS